MSASKYLPHVFVLPEDDANLQIASEFNARLDGLPQRQMQVLVPAGGWSEVLDLFEKVHIAEMRRCLNRSMILLIDFDGNMGRLQQAKNKIPADLGDRVFVLGAWRDPETLKPRLGSYETIGTRMAADCRDSTTNCWGDDHLQHNAAELARLGAYVVPTILFP
jgi:hypothetical protein